MMSDFGNIGMGAADSAHASGKECHDNKMVVSTSPAHAAPVGVSSAADQQQYLVFFQNARLWMQFFLHFQQADDHVLLLIRPTGEFEWIAKLPCEADNPLFTDLGEITAMFPPSMIVSSTLDFSTRATPLRVVLPIATIHEWYRPNKSHATDMFVLTLFEDDDYGMMTLGPLSSAMTTGTWMTKHSRQFGHYEIHRCTSGGTVMNVVPGQADLRQQQSKDSIVGSYPGHEMRRHGSLVAERIGEQVTRKRKTTRSRQSLTASVVSADGTSTCIGMDVDTSGSSTLLPARSPTLAPALSPSSSSPYLSTAPPSEHMTGLANNLSAVPYDDTEWPSLLQLEETIPLILVSGHALVCHCLT